MSDDKHERVKRPRHPKPPDWSSPGRGSRCGAWAATRRRACRQWPVLGKTRCRLHGGASTGPRTEEGSARISEASKREWARWREERGLPPDWRYGSTWLSRRQRETAAHALAKRKQETEERER